MAAGRLLSRQGRNGEGPGENKHLAGIARHADGLVTWDAYHFRVTLLDASGEYVGETKVNPIAMSMSSTPILMMVGAFGNSVLLESSELGFPGAEAARPMEIRLPVEYEIVRLSDGGSSSRAPVQVKRSGRRRRFTPTAGGGTAGYA